MSNKVWTPQLCTVCHEKQAAQGRSRCNKCRFKIQELQEELDRLHSRIAHRRKH